MRRLPNTEPAKCSTHSNGVIKAYSATTNQGLVRHYNEDRVSIVFNIVQPTHRVTEQWPRCSFFGVYDGHGGSACAEFLRDNLHQYVTRNKSFPSDPKEALRAGFEAAERDFLERAERRSPVDRSGSCAIVALIVDDTCYIANVGDSRAVLSTAGGNKVYALSTDHKPSEETERARILQNGGKVYQSTPQGTAGPYRVFPGRLSVSRAFGDAEGKLPSYGGLPNVLIAQPDIRSFKLGGDADFLVLASDGVFDRLSNTQIVHSAWNSLAQDRRVSVHQQCGAAAESILRSSLNSRSLDNVTVVFVAFESFVRHYEKCS